MPRLVTRLSDTPGVASERSEPPVVTSMVLKESKSKRNGDDPPELTATPSRLKVFWLRACPCRRSRACPAAGASDVHALDQDSGNLPHDGPGIPCRGDALELLSAERRAGLDLAAVQGGRVAASP